MLSRICALILGVCQLSFCVAFAGEVQLKTVRGAEILPYSNDLVALCNTVYGEYPYFYDGQDAGYSEYLQTYADQDRGFVCLALDGEKVVGVATGMPLSESRATYQQPFIERGDDLSTIFYFGELVLLSDYRGQGLGERMSREVEQFAWAGSFTTICLCQIETSPNDVRQPSGYISPDRLWIKLGFIRHPELHFSIDWTNIGEKAESPHPMVFWLKSFVRK